MFKFLSLIILNFIFSSPSVHAENITETLYEGDISRTTVVSKDDIEFIYKRKSSPARNESEIANELHVLGITDSKEYCARQGKVPSLRHSEGEEKSRSFSFTCVKKEKDNSSQYFPESYCKDFPQSKIIQNECKDADFRVLDGT